LQGTIKALGIQGKVITLNFIAYWLINMPMSYLLVFKFNIGYKGIWFAIVTAQFFLAFSFHFIIEITDWEKIG
jgi:Na+-driven multidrug efflux pump